MKRIFALLSLICTLTICLVSCASLESYEKNLGSGYTTDYYSEDEIEDLADAFDVDLPKYGVKAVMEATEKNTNFYAYFIECDSSKNAKKLANDLDETVEYLNKYYSKYYTFEVIAKADGKYVLIGNEEVINKALNK